MTPPHTPLQALNALLRTLTCTKCNKDAETGRLGDLRCLDHAGAGVIDTPGFSEALREAQCLAYLFSTPPSDNGPPEPGEFWQHFKGGTYQILTVAMEEATAEPVVVYTGPTGTYTRPLVEFLGAVHRDGYNGPRFTRVGGAGPVVDTSRELARLRSYEAAIRDTICWNVEGPLAAKLLNTQLELDELKLKWEEVIPKIRAVVTRLRAHHTALLAALCDVVQTDPTVFKQVSGQEALDSLVTAGLIARKALGLALDGSEDLDENGEGPPPKLRRLLKKGT